MLYNIFIILTFIIAVAALIVGSLALQRDRRDSIITISENNSNNLSNGANNQEYNYQMPGPLRPVPDLKIIKISPRNILETTNDNGILNFGRVPDNDANNFYVGQSVKEITNLQSLNIIYNNKSLAKSPPFVGGNILKVENLPNDKSILLLSDGISPGAFLKVELYGTKPSVSIGISSGASVFTLTYS